MQSSVMRSEGRSYNTSSPPPIAQTKVPQAKGPNLNGAGVSAAVPQLGSQKNQSSQSVLLASRSASNILMPSGAYQNEASVQKQHTVLPSPRPMSVLRPAAPVTPVLSAAAQPFSSSYAPDAQPRSARSYLYEDYPTRSHMAQELVALGPNLGASYGKSLGSSSRSSSSGSAYPTERPGFSPFPPYQQTGHANVSGADVFRNTRYQTTGHSGPQAHSSQGPRTTNYQYADPAANDLANHAVPPATHAAPPLPEQRPLRIPSSIAPNARPVNNAAHDTQQQRDQLSRPEIHAEMITDQVPSGLHDRIRSAKVEEAGDGMGLKIHVKLMPQELIQWSEIEVLEPISTGTFGEVFRAILHNEEVSVKRCILSKGGGMTKEQLRNLEREINTFRTLDHPNIVTYIGCVLQHPNLAIVTEYLPNGNVFDLLYTRGIQLPAGIRHKIAKQLAQAVSYMHNCDPMVIHRDLKTQNLVLDKDFNMKLCDFGKTKPMDENDMLRLTEDNGGSPRYMAPECFQANGYITEKVDIWSCSCCLIEILGGPLPYEDCPRMSAVISKILKDRQPPMVPAWFHPDIQPILGRSFDFDPNRRPQIAEIQLVLNRLSEEDIQNYGMDKRRTQ